MFIDTHYGCQTSAAKGMAASKMGRQHGLLGWLISENNDKLAWQNASGWKYPSKDKVGRVSWLKATID